MISITPFFHVYHKYVFIMSNISKIKISGTSYSIKDENACKVVELTQAQYDELPTTAKTSNSLFVITDATAGDLSNYYTKSETSGATEISTALASKADTATTYTKTETDNAITAATSTKQDTLVSGTNIKTINNQSILGEGNITIEGGSGGGKAIEAGTNISVTTGETADTINCTLPITADTNVFNTVSVGQGSGGGSYNTLIGVNAKCDTKYGHNVFLVAQNSNNSSEGSYVNGKNNVIIGAIKGGYLDFDIQSFTTSNSVVIGGGGISTDKDNSVAIGYQANVSGTTKTNINNQLTIDTSNQVYIYNKDNTEMICLQDQLGGGGSSYTAGDGIDITNDVISVTGKVDTSTYNTYTAATDTALASKQTTLTAGTGISIVDNVISATGGGGGGKAVSGGTNISITTGETADTINCTLPIETKNNAYGVSQIYIGDNIYKNNNYEAIVIASKDDSSTGETRVEFADGAISIGSSNKVFQNGIVIGSRSTAGASNSWNNIAIGTNVIASGSTKTNINNQIKVDTNNQVYIYNKDNTEMICLQDQLGGGGGTVDTEITSASTNPVTSAAIYNQFGGLKLVKLTQSEFDALSTKDSSTLYIING